MPPDALLHIAVLLLATGTGAFFRHAHKARVPYVTLVLCAVLAMCFFLQLHFSALLGLFERDATAVGAGEWWRIGTALFFQDGGLVGGLFNLVTLLVVGSVAEQIFAPREWLFVYFITGFAAELIALAWQPVGAGNSVAVAGLAGCVLALAPTQRRLFIAASLLAAVAAAVLVYHHDIHGIATILGAGLGLYVWKAKPRSVPA